ncbi:MAG: hypothetical protein Q4A79_03460, partial [Candidatus Saccharibacteria bacterium]|nr:hypothetical protein [Candidatus Saccharibacteria bacterium]
KDNEDKLEDGTGDYAESNAANVEDEGGAIEDEIEKEKSSAAPEKNDLDSSNLKWEEFLAKVQSLNSAIYSQVAKTEYELTSDTLKIYPAKKITRTILTRENNLRILTEAAGMTKVMIMDVGESPSVKNDKLLSQISAIMGGEVQNDGGENPF